MASKGRPYRTVTVEGFEVLIGRGDEENDALTFEVAAPDDLWLHVAGVCQSPANDVENRRPTLAPRLLCSCATPRVVVTHNQIPGRIDMMFRTAFVSAALLAALAVPAGAGGPDNHGKGKGGGQGPVDCEAARCAMQDAIANCPCDTATNHGSYVHCVVRAVKDAAGEHTIPNRCKGKIVRCAAHSSCGKPEKVTCVLPGHCDVSAGTC